MGAPRVTTKEIIEIHRLYKDLGNYAAVGRKVGRSGSTVSKYVKLEGVPANVRQVVEQALKKE